MVSARIGGPIALRAGAARAVVAPLGAELRAWSVGTCEVLWSGDPAWWPQTSPVLFPVCGWTRGGVIRVHGRAYPLGLHGFAATQPFAVEGEGPGRVRLVLTDTEETRAAYPFRFRLAVEYSLTETTLAARFTVSNPNEGILPYALGLHPGFRWPFAAPSRAGHAVVFERPERPEVPVIAPGGLFSSRSRPVPLQGRVLPLADDLFSSEALCFLDLASRRLAFRGGGAAVEVALEAFPHVVLWTKPGAPFLCIEAWTGTGDPEHFTGEITEKPSMRLLAPGEVAQHGIAFTYRERGAA